MEKPTIEIIGGKEIRGSVEVHGAKNSALPILTTTLLTTEKCSYSNVPIGLDDISEMTLILAELGAKRSYRPDVKGSIQLQTEFIARTMPSPDRVRRMRASFIVLGPLLARTGHARLALPGGCSIGVRPIDIHLSGLQKLGAEVKIEPDFVEVTAPLSSGTRKLTGAKIHLKFPSVGATENLMMAAALANGETTISNCAREPEISDLADCLLKMGARIEGAGTSTIKIMGVKELGGVDHKIIGDRIEAGTYLAAGLAATGAVEVVGANPLHLQSVLEVFESCGALIEKGENLIRCSMKARPKSIQCVTGPYPHFPTDMQPQLMAVLCRALGKSTISETVFENRFRHVRELSKFGARIEIAGDNAEIFGVAALKGAAAEATDLRAGASLVIAGLSSEGKTTISEIHHIDRGYENLESKFKKIGAQIDRKPMRIL